MNAYRGRPVGIYKYNNIVNGNKEKLLLLRNLNFDLMFK
jgi:hypothetical protein